VAIFGCHADIDVADLGHTEQNLPPDHQTAISFLRYFPLEPTLLINSGGGLHGYWLFNVPWVFADDEDRTRGKQLLENFQVEMIRQGTIKGWKFDNTSDMVRVLRVPGTKNYKLEQPRDVSVIFYDENNRYTPNQIADAIESIKPVPVAPPPPPAPSTTISTSVFNHLPTTPADITLMRESCPWLNDNFINASSIDYKRWWPTILLIARCNNAKQLAHEFGKTHPKYTHTETEKIIDSTLISLDTVGPVRCDTIRHKFDGEEFCSKCKHYGQIGSPIKLGQQQLPANVSNGVDWEVVASCTEMENAERFLNYFFEEILFCHNRKNWLTYSGKIWEEDNIGKIYERAKSIMRGMKTEAIANQSTGLLKFSMQSESLSKINNTLGLASTDPRVAVTASKFDKENWLFNCDNGTIDLTSGFLKAHDREDYFTKITSVAFDVNATCPLWLKFLYQIMDNKPHMVSYLQRIIGYSMAGTTSEQVVFFLYGSGANGKSTFISAINKIFGDYALHTSFDTFSQQSGSSIRNDLARLDGARFVTASEIERGKHLSEVTIKDICGGEAITARFLHQEYFTFYPVCTVFMSGNHQPVIKSTDDGIWRRIHLVPFNVSIPENQRDKSLLQKLENELPGILNWAVQGCLSWQKVGLKPPAEVVNATKAYRSDMDILADFLDDCCMIGPVYKVTKGDVYNEYTTWCLMNSDKAVSKKAFGRMLMDRGFGDKKSGDWYWLGLGLKSTQNTQQTGGFHSVPNIATAVPQVITPASTGNYDPNTDDVIGDNGDWCLLDHLNEDENSHLNDIEEVIDNDYAPSWMDED
jgi:putative DNA primase/helicase